MNIVAFAKELSHKLHAGQFRNDGKTPYHVHTDYVGDNAYKFYKSDIEYGNGCSKIELVTSIGYLHDVLEDCLNGNIQLLIKLIIDGGFNKYLAEDIARMVHILSRYYKDSSIIYYLSDIRNSLICRAVKLADLEHNLSDLGPGNLRDKYHLCQNFLRN